MDTQMTDLADRIAEMGVEFCIPSQAAGAVTLERYASEAQGITGLAPFGWTVLDEGAWTRSDPASDPTFFVQFAAPAADAPEANAGAFARFGGLSLGDAVAEFQIGGLDWTVYEPESSSGIVAATSESGDRALFVALSAAAGEPETLTDALLRPALAALDG